MKILYLIGFFILFYSFIVLLWYLNPARFFGIKYNVKNSEIRNIESKTGNLYVVCHDNNPFADIMIMSNEVKKLKNKSHLVSGKSNTIYKTLPKVTPYNIIQTGDNTVKKCIEKIKKGENVVMFYRNEFKGKGIYYILKETNAKLLLVNKKNLKEEKEVKSDFDKIINMFGGKFDIIYQELEYDLEKIEAENFIEKIKNKLK